MAKRKGYLLYRIEGSGDGRQKVWLYEELQKHDLNARLRNGWAIWKS